MAFLIIGGGSVVTALMVYQTVQHSVGTVANLGRDMAPIQMAATQGTVRCKFCAMGSWESLLRCLS